MSRTPGVRDRGQWRRRHAGRAFDNASRELRVRALARRQRAPQRAARAVKFIVFSRARSAVRSALLCLRHDGMLCEAHGAPARVCPAGVIERLARARAVASPRSARGAPADADRRKKATERRKELARKRKELKAELKAQQAEAARIEMQEAQVAVMNKH